MGNAASLQPEQAPVGSPKPRRSLFSSDNNNEGILRASASLNAGAIPLPKAMSVLVQRDPDRVTFLELKTVSPLYRVALQSEVDGSATVLVQNRKGRVLFVSKTLSSAHKVIYQVPQPEVPEDATETSCSSLSSGSGGRGGSKKGGPLAAAGEAIAPPPPPKQPASWSLKDLPQVAQLNLDRKSGKANLSWNAAGSSNGAAWSKVYKGLLVPGSEFGLLITDAKGAVVCKGDIDKKKQQPLLKISPGADLPSVLCLALALYGDF